jgi:hypothetical protein
MSKSEAFAITLGVQGYGGNAQAGAGVFVQANEDGSITVGAYGQVGGNAAIAKGVHGGSLSLSDAVGIVIGALNAGANLSLGYQDGVFGGSKGFEGQLSAGVTNNMGKQGQNAIDLGKAVKGAKGISDASKVLDALKAFGKTPVGKMMGIQATEDGISLNVGKHKGMMPFDFGGSVVSTHTFKFGTFGGGSEKGGGGNDGGPGGSSPDGGGPGGNAPGGNSPGNGPGGNTPGNSPGSSPGGGAPSPSFGPSNSTPSATPSSFTPGAPTPSPAAQPTPEPEPGPEESPGWDTLGGWGSREGEREGPGAPGQTQPKDGEGEGEVEGTPGGWAATDRESEPAGEGEPSPGETELAPILLDLDGNGVSITERSRSNVFFDTVGDGYKHRTAWAGAGDGVLAIDANDDGLITERNEITFTDWDPSADGDMSALRNVFDTNNNGQLDAGDARARLRVGNRSATRLPSFRIVVTNTNSTTSGNMPVARTIGE